MTRSLRAAFTLFAILGIASTASEVEAQCPPYARFCASVGARVPVFMPVSRGAQIVVTVGPPPPQIVYVRPAPPPPPPVVYVQPVPQPPQPQVIYVRPQPQPQVVYGQYGQPATNAGRNPTGTTGLHFYAAGAAGGQSARLGGVGGAIRLRKHEHFAVDLGVGVFGGSDYYGRARAELPITADFIAFLNPQHRAQFYLLGGVGASFAFSENSSGNMQRSYTYVGAETGAGIEFRLTRGFALNVDGRGFLRRQPSGSPEFVNPTTGATTRVSGGFMGQVGTTFYF